MFHLKNRRTFTLFSMCSKGGCVASQLGASLCLPPGAFPHLGSLVYRKSLEESLSLAQTQSAYSDPDRGRAFSEAIPPQLLLKTVQQRKPQVTQERQCDQVRRAAWEGEDSLYKVNRRGTSLSRYLDLLPRT
jgi:hypothetical protein